MKMLQYFTQFLRDTINLNKPRLNGLDARVDRITAALNQAQWMDRARPRHRPPGLVRNRH